MSTEAGEVQRLIPAIRFATKQSSMVDDNYLGRAVKIVDIDHVNAERSGMYDIRVERRFRFL